MARKITISFKETTKDIELYSYLIALEDKSTEIKNIIREGLSKSTNKRIVEKVNKEEVNIMDF